MLFTCLPMSLDTLKAFTLDLFVFSNALGLPSNHSGLPSGKVIKNSIAHYQSMALDSILHGNVALHLAGVLLMG